MDNEKYEILLEELAEVLKKKNEKIKLQEHVIDSLTKIIIAAEMSAKNSGKPNNIERR